MVCSSSCKRSFLTASHYMSDAYAWFGCAYFIYDMWAMYEVHLQKIADKLKFTKDNNDVTNGNVIDDGLLYDKLPNGSQTDEGYHSNGVNNTNTSTIKEKNLERAFFVKKLSKVPCETPSFINYCITHPVMTIHHVFLGSFGLLVIVVCFCL